MVLKNAANVSKSANNVILKNVKLVYLDIIYLPILNALTQAHVLIILNQIVYLKHAFNVMPLVKHV